MVSLIPRKLWPVQVMVVVVLMSLLPSQASGKRILVVALMSHQSHRITYQPLLEALAAKGHVVTVISPLKSKKIVRNIREIVAEPAKKETQMPNVFELKEQGREFSSFDSIRKYGRICLESLTLPQLKELRNESFDLIIVPAVFNECGLAYAHGFNTSTILFSAGHLPGLISWPFGNPLTHSYVPLTMTGLSGREMNFYARALNFLFTLARKLHYYHYCLPFLEESYRRLLNDSTIPPMLDLIRNVSLILVNTHFSFVPPMPWMPNIVEVGGMHCRPAQALPQDLDDFVNSASDGFILFSMGSALKADQISEQKRLRILEAFSGLKQKVLWKWDGEAIPNLPPNVKLSKWLPQQDLLGHPKIRLFITHGGLGSTTEAIFHGVPLIGIPMFADQYGNTKFAEDGGFGIRLNFNQLTEQAFPDAIHKIINNKTYAENVRVISGILRDQPEKPLERAVFWTEYVMRHGGAVHMRSAALDLNFFQYYSLDVIGLILLIIIATITIIFAFLKFLFQIGKPIANSTKRKKE